MATRISPFLNPEIEEHMSKKKKKKEAFGLSKKMSKHLDRLARRMVEHPEAHPDHYNIEPGFDVLDLITKLGWLNQFALANVLKYVIRFEKTGNCTDLVKAETYLRILIDKVECEGKDYEQTCV